MAFKIRIWRVGLAGTVIARQAPSNVAVNGRTLVTRAVLSLLVFAALASCSDEGGRLSLEEGLKCASDEFKGHRGAFSQHGNTIAYSYDSPNGPANVIVTFDDRRRPVSTFFESSPLGSHQELMEAARAMKDCVAYGPKARGEKDKAGATSMLGR